MSTVLTRRPTARGRRDREPSRQTSLFGQVVAPPPLPAREEPTAPHAPVEVDDAPRTLIAGPTLDEAISALWSELTRSQIATCPVCGDALEPRHSAGAGVVGGRCGSCLSTLA